MARQRKTRRDRSSPRRPVDRITWALWLSGGVLGTLPTLTPALESLVWIAPVAWLLAATRKGPMLLPAYVGGVIYVAMPSAWLLRIGVGPWLASAMYFSLFTTVGCWALWRTRQRLGLPAWILGPVVFSACEVTRLEFSAFATTWYNFGNLLADHDHLRQSAEWGTGIALSLLPLAVAGAIVEALLAYSDGGRAALLSRRVLGGVVLSVVLLTGFWIHGAWVLSSTRLETGPTLALVQPSIPQSLKNVGLSRDAVIQRHLDLTRHAAPEGVDLIVWPETAATLFLPKEAEVRSVLARLCRDMGAPLLMGAQGETVREDGDTAPTNSAFLLDHGGRILAQWNKRQLVPLVETLLWIDDVSWLRRRLGLWFHEKFHFYPFLAPGRDAVVAEVPGAGWKVGAAICYDDVIPEITRDLVDAGAEVVVILSNEAWFGSGEFHQHVAMARLRAVESRVPLVRATNTGLTCVIDPLGRVTASLPTDEPGVLVQATRLSSRAPAPRWMPEGYCWAMFAAGLALVLATFRRRSS